jgi:hypothetical protein
MTGTVSGGGRNPLGHIALWGKRLAALAALLYGAIGKFWSPPPPELAAEAQSTDDVWKPFARFVIVLLLGLMVLPMMRWACSREHTRKWTITAALAVTAGIVVFFSYNYLLDQWTVESEGKRYYVGTELREELKTPRLMKMQPRDLLSEGEWNPLEIWTEPSLRRRHLILSGIYVLCAPVFAVAMLAALQTAYCATRKQRASPARRAEGELRRSGT